MYIFIIEEIINHIIQKRHQILTKSYVVPMRKYKWKTEICRR